MSTKINVTQYFSIIHTKFKWHAVLMVIGYRKTKSKTKNVKFNVNRHIPEVL
jgi:hypothetical protein